jgi:hypothetical protein
MKISHKDLKELYRSYLEDELPVSRDKCPLPEDIAAWLRGEISKKRRHQIIDHIFHCVYCHEEFEFALETIREEKKFIHDVDTIFQEIKHKKENKFFQFFPFRLSWLYSLILITGVVLITLLVKNITQEHKYRGSESNSVILISPNKNAILKAQLRFEWKDIQNADYYILEIFDESLYPAWESDKIIVNNTLIPEEIINKFVKKKSYYWMVTAVLSDGKTFESRLQNFIISD